jgi:predicted ATPase/DNA-binding SARP family transcriptional activator
MDYAILGPLEVRDGGRLLEVRGQKERAILGLLIVEAGTVVSSERLVFELWGDEPPDTALPTLRSHVSRLRRALGRENEIVTQRPGYLLDLDSDRVDSFRFEAMADRAGKTSRDPATAVRLAREALSLWRGRALTDLEEFLFAQDEERRLEERRLTTLEVALEAELSLGNHVEIVPELDSLTGRHPYRERFWAQLMLALYRSARAGEALEAYSQAERALGETLGIGPSADLRSLERSIVMEDSALDLSEHSPPNNLAAAWSSFVGRESELVALVDALGGSRVITLTGVGGSGKSRLALECASRVVSLFSDGVFRVELAPIKDPDVVASAVSLALGEPASHASDPIIALLEYLGDRHLLLLLDNCEHLLTACGDLVSRLVPACPRLSVLVTSREPLRMPGETVWLVRPLQLPDPDAPPSVQESAEAFRLFVERAKAARPDFVVTDDNREHITDLCRVLSGLPLALELAAARSMAFDPEQLLARLREGIEVLSGGSTLTRRHQTMQSALDWSYRLLDTGLARLFRGLAVFRDGWTVEDAHYVVGDPGSDTADAIAALVEKSLVEVAPGSQGRYRLLEPVREFALHLFSETDEAEATRARHAARYLAVAEQADRGLRGADQLLWLGRMRADHDNIRAALDWAITAGPDTALRLVAACAWFWFMAGHWRDSWAWLRQALNAAGEEHPGLRAKAVYTAGGIQVIRVNPAPVLRLIDQALDDCRELGDRFGEAWCLHLIGHAALYQSGERYSAEERLRALVDARDIFEEMDRPWEMAWSHRYIGDALILEGKTKAGIELQLESISAFREMGDRWSTAFGLHNVANMMLRDADYGPEKARSYWQRCLRISEDLGDPVWTAHAINGLAVCSFLMGETTAEPQFKEAEDRLRLIGDDNCLSSALGFLGDLHRRKGDWSTSVGYYADSLRLRQRLASRPGITYSLDRLALLAVDTGHETEAGRLAAATHRVVETWGEEYPGYYRDMHAELVDRIEPDDRDEDIENVIPYALELAAAIGQETPAAV